MAELEAQKLASKMAGASISSGEGASDEGVAANGEDGKKQAATSLDGEQINVESPDVD
tara:strand:- start:41 stop:214 length:174 start_codon:yes stop_codon:yes gene_type:complete